jgi:glycosyltransferase involved in cell wall biosynthesis
MKVVHISTSFKGGAGRSAYRIHQALRKSGIESAFLSLDYTNVALDKQNYLPDTTLAPKPGFWGKIYNRLHFRSKKHLGIELSQSMRLRQRFEAISSLLDAEFTSLPFSDIDVLQTRIVQEADIVHLHWVPGILDYPGFFKYNTKPVVWTLHDMNPFQGIFHYKEDEKRNATVAGKLDKAISVIKRKAIWSRKMPLNVITPSAWLLKAAMDSATFKNVPCACIPYPLDTELYSSHKNPGFRGKYQIPASHLLLLFVAQYTTNHRKGFDLLKSALEQLVNIPITLIIIGDAMPQTWEHVNVKYIGTVTDEQQLQYYFANADAVVLPSREDNLPNVMLESLAVGVPVIGFSIGGIGDTIQHLKTGVLAGEISAEGFADAIQLFYEKLSSFDSAVISNIARQQYNETHISKQYESIYAGLLNE